MDDDLIEAIQYFQAGDDSPSSSAASILSGSSFGARKITLRVDITLDYDGPSLSDTSSLASLEDSAGWNRSQQSFSFGSPSVDLDDDSVTVSSRDLDPQRSSEDVNVRGSVCKTQNNASSVSFHTHSPNISYTPLANSHSRSVMLLVDLLPTASSLTPPSSAVATTALTG